MMRELAGEGIRYVFCFNFGLRKRLLFTRR